MFRAVEKNDCGKINFFNLSRLESDLISALITLVKIMVETVSEIASLWGRILQKVKEKLNDPNIFDAFFAASYVDHMEGSTLVVVVNTGLAACQS